MVRFLVLAIVALVLFLLVRSIVRSFLDGLRGVASGGRARQAIRDELVKDPVCETYIPRRKAIARGAGSDVRYFCSVACADKFTSRA